LFRVNNQKHTVKNVGTDILIIHENQIGTLLEESDIVRERLPDHIEF